MQQQIVSLQALEIENSDLKEKLRKLQSEVCVCVCVLGRCVWLFVYEQR